MASSAYSRTQKNSLERKSRYDGRLVKNLSKIEPKKIGIGLVAGCCLVLLTYISLAKFFAIYSPVFWLSEDQAPTKLSNTETLPKEIVARNETVETKPDANEEDEEKTSKKPTEVDQLQQREPELDPTEENDFVNLGDKVSRTTNPTPSTAPEESSKSTISELYGKNDKSKSEPAAPRAEPKLTCDDKSVDEGFPYARPEYCDMSGDIRISPKQLTAFFVSPSTPPALAPSGERRLRPYARKDNFLLPGVREVVLKSAGTDGTDNSAPSCTTTHAVPAVVFSVAGYTGNFFHDTADVLIPLFLTSAHYKGEVQFFITNYKPWWVHKYQPVLRKLSRYEPIDFDSDSGVHCFSHATIGLVRDRDLIIYPNPTRNPRNYSMVDFTRFMRAAYGLPRALPAALGEEPGRKPRMLIISRGRTRKLLNLREVAAMAEEMGFRVDVSEAGADVPRFAELVNSCDVLLAVHGAGLTNQVFLPTRAVMVQIVPWGKMDWMATNFYGQPARDMNLKYVEYYISREESTLIDRYPKDHLVFTNPLAIHGQGWKALADIIMTQDVKLDLWRFRPTLLETLNLLQE
ncbi:uncharacterized protein LOC109710539 isoform X2 [Ananas comosus]|uniref:Uncharacterized protein LOC109710539 isoform X2 n=1 Tax=Ananas comosus TaxID=4615 RepID=A0A6P5EZ12_ANACO|nr:uncharacterized protein LOC109710539 isoform X2 [Ananas comosus]